MTTQTTRHPTFPPHRPASRASACAGAGASQRASPRAPGARPKRARTRAQTLAIALLGPLALCVDAAQARVPHAHRPASAPSTEQILAPSAATVPDALPPDKRVWRCGDSYAAHPCPGGDAGARPLDIADPHSDAQRRQSQDISARDKRLAAWYEAGRRQRETVASAPASGRAAAAPPACVDTTMMHCVPNKPRTRKVASTGASSPALARRR